MNWFYADEGNQVGPVDELAFEGLVREGKITPETRVWHDQLPDWMRYGDVATAGTEMRTCVECGQSFPESETVAFGTAAVCAACKPVYVQKLKEGIAPTGTLNYAGFWIRFVASFLDSIILFLVGFVLGLAITAVAGRSVSPGLLAYRFAVGLVLGLSYMVYFNGSFGATPGKMVLGLKIVRPDGSPISYGRAFGRYFALWLSRLTLLIGFMMAGWDEEKRALHDRVADTRVIKT